MKPKAVRKPFKLNAEKIQRLIPRIGGAIATDKITVEGNRVDYMIRETSSREDVSGWIFYGGGETQEYIDDPANSAIYELNTICNYDPDIIPFLTYPPGTEIERNREGSLEVIRNPDTEPSIRFMYPADEGVVTLSRHWRLFITERMFRRLDGSSLVLWREGLTFWINFHNATAEAVESRVKAMQKLASPNATGMEVSYSDGIGKMRYFSIEQTEEGSQSAAYLYGFSKKHEVHMVAYYDSSDFASELDLAWNSLEYTGTPQG